MSTYEPQTWADAITGLSAARMIYIENGIAAAHSELAGHIAAATLDHPDASVTDAKIGSRTIATTAQPSTSTGELLTLLNGLARQIKNSTGKTNWYDAPSSSIEALYNLTVNQGIARPTTSTQTLINLASQIVMLLKEIKGTTNWYDAPVASLATLNTQLTGFGNISTVCTVSSNTTSSVYQAASDGFLFMSKQQGSQGSDDFLYTDANASPSTGYRVGFYGSSGSGTACLFPIKKNNYYKYTNNGGGQTATLYWIPLA
jgi:hypothetical protein